jgi:hypothetical protein
MSRTSSERASGPFHGRAAPCEGEELLRQPLRLFGGLLGSGQVLGDVPAVARIIPRERDVGDDPGQEVVEVMGQAACKGADGLELLCPHQFFLYFPAGGNVRDHGKACLAVAENDRVRNDLDIQNGAVLSPVLPESRRRTGGLPGGADIHQRHGKELFAGIAIMPDGRVIHGEETECPGVNDPHGVGIVLEQVAIAFLALPYLLFHPLPVVQQLLTVQCLVDDRGKQLQETQLHVLDDVVRGADLDRFNGNRLAALSGDHDHRNGAA